MPGENDIIVKRQGQTAVVHLGVRLGAKQLGKWSEVLEGLVAIRGATVVVDFFNTQFISSQAIGVLLAARTEALRRDSTILLANVQPAVLRVLRISRLDTLFPIKDGFWCFTRSEPLQPESDPGAQAEQTE